MPATETLERFIARVEQNDHAGAVEEFYLPDASLQENQSAPRIGRDTQIKRERDLLTKARTISSRCVRPVFISGDRVVIRWQFRFDWLDGTATQMEEIAYHVGRANASRRRRSSTTQRNVCRFPNPVRSGP
jgi:hypothetical protein